MPLFKKIFVKNTYLNLWNHITEQEVNYTKYCIYKTKNVRIILCFFIKKRLQLLKDMRHNNVKQDKYSFTYNLCDTLKVKATEAENDWN